MDLIYQVLKQATDLSNNSKPNRSSPYDQQQQQQEAQRSQVPDRTSGNNGPISGAGSSGSSSGQSLHKFRSIAGAALNVQQRSITASSSTTSNLTVSNPAPHSTSSGVNRFCLVQKLIQNSTFLIFVLILDISTI